MLGYVLVGGKWEADSLSRGAWLVDIYEKAGKYPGPALRQAAVE